MANVIVDTEQPTVSPTLKANVVAAIDFGTKYSGYAFRIKGQEEINVYTNWEGGGYSKYKTPTCILFNEDESTREFGQEAVEEYIGMEPDDKESAIFFSNFKMNLHRKVDEDGASLDEELMLMSPNGSKMAAIDVFAKSLKYLKEHFFTNVEDMSGFIPKKEEVIWVVTVPAIWEDSAKYFMRAASLQAGLIDSFESDRLLIALEPEVAALCCRTIPIAQYSRDSGAISLPIEGDSLLVVDAGGGTVDIVALQVIGENALRQLHWASGGAHGGQAVDANFSALMEEIFTDEVIDDFQTANGSAYVELMQNFEEAKRKYHGQKAMRIALPVIFLNTLTTAVIKQKIAEYNQKTSSTLKLTSQQYLTVPPDSADKLFQPVIDAIIKCTKEVYDHPNMQSVKVFFLVGGFAECKLLHRRLQAAFQSVRVLVPKDSGFAVLKGAVLFGENPLVVTERIAPRSYGTAAAQLYDPNRHGDEDSLKRDGHIRVKSGKKYVVDLFESYIRMGDTIENGYTVEKTFSPLYHSCGYMIAKIYSSSKRDVKYVNEKSCSELGVVKIPLRQTGEDRPYTLRLRFGGTEIHAHIRDNVTGEVSERQIKYNK